MSILESKYKAVQALTRSFVANLSAEDQMMQPCREARLTTRHPAYTTCVVQSLVVDYRTFQEKSDRLFNNYYISLGGESPDKKPSASFSHPSLDEVLSFRVHFNHEMVRLFSSSISHQMSWCNRLGLGYEQRHQEIALADIKPFKTNVESTAQLWCATTLSRWNVKEYV